MGNNSRQRYPPANSATGVIYLLDMRGDIIDCRIYHNRGIRKTIIANWQGRYNKKTFKTFFIQIVPNINERKLEKITLEKDKPKKLSSTTRPIPQL